MSMEKIVKGGTKIKLAAPKSKYVEPILSATRGGENGVAEVFNTLQLRLRDSTWTIVFKSLIIVHLMLRDGAPDVTLRYLAESPKRLAISQFTEVQTQGVNIRRYFEYLMEKVMAYKDTQTDFVRSGTSKIRSLTVDKGLLRQTEIVQKQIRALLKCDLLGGQDPDNEISMTAFRLLTMDLMELFKVMNEGTISVLEGYFEMSKVDAQRALKIYKTFSSQTDNVVQYLSMARQYQTHTRLEVPKLKHAPTTLTSSLEEYLNDPDFEVNRRQYMAQQEAKRTGKPMPKPQPVQRLAEKSDAVTSSTSAVPVRTSQPRGPAPDLIDFFEAIDQNQQSMGQPQYTNPPPANNGYAQAQAYQQPQQTAYNPFLQNYPSQALPQQQQQPPQVSPLQTDFTGAGFGGFGPQNYNPQTAFVSPYSAVSELGPADFSQQQQQQQQQQFPTPIQSPQGIQSQQTGTNPFRQSMLPPANNQPFNAGQGATQSPLQRQSTNPFAKNNATSAFPSQSGYHPSPTMSPISEAGGTTFSPVSQQTTALQPQKTGGTNPFAKPTTSPPPAALPVHVTGSTNPFRQSQFVNQQTGQGWQHSAQGTFGGYDINNVDTIGVFPRPGVQS